MDPAPVQDNNILYNYLFRFIIYIYCKYFPVTNGISIQELNLFMADRNRVVMHLHLSDRTEITFKSFHSGTPCMLKLMGNNPNLFSFVIENIRAGVNHIKPGVLRSSPNQHGVVEVSLPDLTDSNNKNMLMVATISNRLDIVQELFSNGFDSSNVENKDDDGKMAVDYAWLNCDNPGMIVEADQIFAFLLRQNSVFPKDFIELRASTEVKEFIDMCSIMRRYIFDGNTADLVARIDENVNQRHFYDSSNKSLFTHTLEIENLDMLSLLKSKNIIAGKHEDNSQLTEDIRTKNVQNSSSDPDNHIHILKSRTNVSHGEVATDDKFQRRDKALNFLNERFSVILKAASVWNNIKIIFDFTKRTTDRVDPDSGVTTTGIVHDSGVVVIGALNLMSGSMNYASVSSQSYNDDELTCYGAFLHEMTHGAVKMTFMNDYNPYPMGESARKNEYIKIYNEIKKKCQKEDLKRHKTKLERDRIVHIVFDYPEDQQHSELIVRPAQMDVTYHNDIATKNSAHRNFNPLYNYLFTYVIQEFGEATRVRNLLNDRLINVEFNDLTVPMKAKIKHSTILFQGVETSFYDMFGNNEQPLRHLSLENIRTIVLDDKIAEIFGDLPCTLDDKARVFKRSIMNLHQRSRNSSHLLKMLKNQPIFILSADPGAGKTKFIEHLANQMKRKYRTIFIVTIKPSEHRDVIRNFISTTDLSVSDILRKILEIDDGFETESFDHLLSIGSVIVLFDEIHLIERNLILTFFERIKAENNIHVWITTRPHLQQPLEQLFATTSYKFIPISQNKSSRMLQWFLKNLDETKNPDNLMSVLKILEGDRFGGVQVVDCPAILESLAKIYFEDDIDFQPDSLNLHNILDKCVNALEVHFSANIPRNINLVRLDPKDFQVLALKTDFGVDINQLLEPIAKSLSISTDWEDEKDDRRRNGKFGSFNHILEQLGLYSLGEATSKVKPLHMIVPECHFGQFLTKYLFKENSSIADVEYVKILDLLRLTAKYPNDFEIVHKIIFGYAATSQRKLSTRMSELLMSKVEYIRDDFRDCEFKFEAEKFWSSIDEIMSIENQSLLAAPQIAPLQITWRL